MIKTKSVDVKVCDFCETDDCVFDHCLACGKHACYNCKKKVGVEYKHGVYFSGAGDGFFCNQCLIAPPKKLWPLLEAYRKIAALRAEQKALSEDFEIRSKTAEKEVEKLYEQAHQDSQ